MTPEEAVKQYQCPGCVSAPYLKCFKKEGDLACTKHYPGTRISQVGAIFLGLPKGFNRLGFYEKTKIYIFKTLSDGWHYDKFNRPAWKYLDPFENTIVRGLSPRVNLPWIHIFLENCLKQIQCIEITIDDINEMD